MTEELKGAGFDVLEDGQSVQYVPTDEELEKCFEFGKTIARKAKA